MPGSEDSDQEPRAVSWIWRRGAPVVVGTGQDPGICWGGFEGICNLFCIYCCACLGICNNYGFYFLCGDAFGGVVGVGEVVGAGLWGVEGGVAVTVRSGGSLVVLASKRMNWLSRVRRVMCFVAGWRKRMKMEP